jgi:hypothetical protein
MAFKVCINLYYRIVPPMDLDPSGKILNIKNLTPFPPVVLISGPAGGDRR